MTGNVKILSGEDEPGVSMNKFPWLAWI